MLATSYGIDNDSYIVTYFITKERNISIRTKKCDEMKALEVSHISWKGKILKLAAQSKVLLEKI